MNLGFSEMVFLFVLALLIFGPKKLPEIGRQIGKAMTEFKRASNEFKSQFESELRQIEVTEALRKEKQVIEDTIRPIRDFKSGISTDFTLAMDVDDHVDAPADVTANTEPSPVADPYLQANSEPVVSEPVKSVAAPGSRETTPSPEVKVTDPQEKPKDA